MKKNNSRSSHGSKKTVFNGSQREKPLNYKGSSSAKKGGSAAPVSRDQRSSSSKSNSVASVSIPRSWRLITGTHAVFEALRVRPETIKMALIQRNVVSTPEMKELVNELRNHKIRTEEKHESDLAKLAASHQGVIIFSDYNPEFEYLNAGWEESGLIVALDGVEDPHNLGAILRTSWLMGVQGLIIPQDRAVGLTSAVHKVACGGVEHVPIARINNFNEPFSALKEAGFWVYGLSHRATKTIYDIKFPEKVIWVLGAEDKGLRQTTERACDELVCIPQISPDASYNVSVATAMALAETKRQWSQRS